jgi:hypothetical protein
MHVQYEFWGLILGMIKGMLHHRGFIIIMVQLYTCIHTGRAASYRSPLQEG